MTPCSGCNLTSYKKCSYYVGIKLFRTVPSNNIGLNHGIKAFKPVLILKHYLLSHSYSVEFTDIRGQTVLQVLFKYILISLKSFVVIPNSVTTLYSTSLLTES